MFDNSNRPATFGDQIKEYYHMPSNEPQNSNVENPLIGGTKLSHEQRQLLAGAIQVNISKDRQELENLLMDFHRWKERRHETNFRVKGEPIEASATEFFSEVNKIVTRIEKLQEMFRQATRGELIVQVTNG